MQHRLEGFVQLLGDDVEAFRVGIDIELGEDSPVVGRRQRDLRILGLLMRGCDCYRSW